MNHKAITLYYFILLSQLTFNLSLNATEIKLNTTFNISKSNKIKSPCIVHIYNNNNYYNFEINDGEKTVSINEGNYLIELESTGYQHDFIYSQIAVLKSNENKHIKFKLNEMTDTYLEYSHKLNNSINYSQVMGKRIKELTKTNYDFDFYHSPASFKLNKLYKTYLINNRNKWNDLYAKRYLNTIRLFNSMNILEKDILVRIIDDENQQINTFQTFIQIDIPQKYFTSKNLYNSLNYYVPSKLLDSLIEVFKNYNSGDRQILTGKRLVFEENKNIIQILPKLKLLSQSALNESILNKYNTVIRNLHLKTCLLDDIRYIVFNTGYIDNRFDDTLYLNIESFNYTEEKLLKLFIEEIYANKVKLQIKESFRNRNNLIYDPDNKTWKAQNEGIVYNGNTFTFESEIISEYIKNYIVNTDDNLNIDSIDILNHLIGDTKKGLSSSIDYLIIKKSFNDAGAENISFSLELNSSPMNRIIKLNLADDLNKLSQLTLLNNDNSKKYEGSISFSNSTSAKYLDITGIIYEDGESFKELNVDLDFLLPLSVKENDKVAPELITDTFKIKYNENILNLSLGINENDTMSDDINCYISIQGPNNNQIELFSIGVDNGINSFDSTKSRINISKQLNKFLPSGIYNINLIELIDATGNISSYPIDILFEDEEKYFFEINNIHEDITPPTFDLNSLNLSYEKISLETESIIPVLKIQCEDSQSGISLLSYHDNDEPNIIYYTEVFKYEIIDGKEYSYFYLFDLNTMENGTFVNVLDITDKVNNSTTINIQLMVDKTQIDIPKNTDLILKINIVDGYLGISFPTNELLYKIESSIDLIEWKTITQFRGNNDIYYYLTDDKLTNNRKFYRVKSID